MGIFEALKSMFSKQRSLTSAEERLENAFSSVHSDISNLKMSAKSLHAGSQLTKQDIQNMTAWLGYLKRDSEKAEKNFEKISSWLVYLQESGQKNKNEIEKLHLEIENLKTNTLQHMQRALQTLPTGVGMRNSEESTSTTMKLIKGVATGVGNVANVGFATFTTSKELPNPLKSLLNLMISISEPVTYEQISQRTGKSKITVRVNMNLLKKRGLVEEHNTPSGVKLFTVSNKEKVKTLYNVEMI